MRDPEPIHRTQVLVTTGSSTQHYDECLKLQDPICLETCTSDNSGGLKPAPCTMHSWANGQLSGSTSGQLLGNKIHMKRALRFLPKRNGNLYRTTCSSLSYSPIANDSHALLHLEARSSFKLQTISLKDLETIDLRRSLQSQAFAPRN